MRSRPLMTLRLDTAPTQNIDAGPHGTRFTFPVTGGSFDGCAFFGEGMRGGQGLAGGIRDDAAPGTPYFRTLPRFETAAPKYSFLNRLLAVGTGQIRADGPVHVIEELL